MTFLLLFSCESVNIDDAQKHSWKNNEGAYIRDVIVFGKNKAKGFYLDADLKVYYEGKFVGTLIKANSNQMVILTSKNEKSYYVSF